MQIIYFKMWWILIALSICTEVRGYANGRFPESCESMLPKHEGPKGVFYAPQRTEPPFELDYKLGNKGEPITVFLRSKQPTGFRGFMLQARQKGMMDDSRPLGKFIQLDRNTRLLRCSNVEGSAVSQANNARKTSAQANWTAEGKDLDIAFRATFLQEYGQFWERVDVDVILPTPTPPLPTTTTTPTQPSTAASTTKPSTTTSTAKPSTTTSTAKPTTTTSTAKPSTTASTAKPSTTASTAKPSSTTSTAKPSTTTRTEKPSTTTRTAKPSTTTRTAKPSTTANTVVPSATRTTNPSTAESSGTNSSHVIPTIPFSTALTPPQRGSRISDRTLLQSSTTLIVFDNLFVAVSMELPNIFMITLTGSPFSRDLIKVSQILCSLLCVAVEISALILLCVANSLKVTLIALVCVLIVMSYIKLIIVSLPIGPSHELKHICDVAVKVCSVIHIILTTALVFVGVLEIADCIKKRKESWLLKVIIAYTVWMFLLIVWTFVFSAHRNAILGRRKTGSSKNSNGWRQQRRKKKLGATEATVTAISVILIVGIIAFSAALIAGIFSEKRARA